MLCSSCLKRWHVLQHFNFHRLYCLWQWELWSADYTVSQHSSTQLGILLLNIPFAYKWLEQRQILSSPSSCSGCCLRFAMLVSAHLCCPCPLQYDKSSTPTLHPEPSVLVIVKTHQPVIVKTYQLTHYFSIRISSHLVRKLTRKRMERPQGKHIQFWDKLFVPLC